MERATFDESPYSPTQIRNMLAAGSQCAWLAMAGNIVVGFVTSFPTYSLRGPSWEVDLLAVHPDWTGRGLGSRLIRAITATGTATARRARAVVADDNVASAQAFARAGFRPVPEACDLLIYRPKGLASPLRPVTQVAIREAVDIPQVVSWLDSSSIQCHGKAQAVLLGKSRRAPGTGGYEPADAAPNPGEQGLTVLLAEQKGQPAGYAELIQVQTVLYRGVWIESLAATARVARTALVREAVSRARVADLDEIGAMVPASDWLLQKALLAEGFSSLGKFHWLVAELPIPDPPVLPPSFLHTGKPPGGNRA